MIGDIKDEYFFNATSKFHLLSINILLFGNPDLSDQDNHIIFDAVHSFIKRFYSHEMNPRVRCSLYFFPHHLLRVRDVFRYRCVSVFLPPYTVCYCFTSFLFLKFCVMCRVPIDEESF